MIKHVEADVKCMQTNFGGHGLFGFGDITTFQITHVGQVSLSDDGGQKIKSTQKIHTSRG